MSMGTSPPTQAKVVRAVHMGGGGDGGRAAAWTGAATPQCTVGRSGTVAPGAQMTAAQCVNSIECPPRDGVHNDAWDEAPRVAEPVAGDPKPVSAEAGFHKVQPDRLDDPGWLALEEERSRFGWGGDFNSTQHQRDARHAARKLGARQALDSRYGAAAAHVEGPHASSRSGSGQAGQDDQRAYRKALKQQIQMKQAAKRAELEEAACPRPRGPPQRVATNPTTTGNGVEVQVPHQRGVERIGAGGVECTKPRAVVGKPRPTSAPAVRQGGKRGVKFDKWSALPQAHEQAPPRPPGFVQ
eukprot:gene26785-32914_t